MLRPLKFFKSLYLKVMVIFILILLIIIEIIGVNFMDSIEKENINKFEESVKMVVPEYVTNQIARSLTVDGTNVSNQQIKDIISDIDTSSVSNIEVFDVNGVERATSNFKEQTSVGRKTTNNSVKDVLHAPLTSGNVSYRDDNGMTYVLIMPLRNPKGNSTHPIGAIELKANMQPVYNNIHQISLKLLWALAIAALLGVIIVIIVSNAFSTPIYEMKNQTVKMAQGDYSGAVHVYSNDELGQLAMAINNLSVRVEEAQDISDSERRRLDRVLTHMSDGVLATDRRGKIQIANKQAQKYLNTPEDGLIGKSIVDVLPIDGDGNLHDLLMNNAKTDIILEQNDGEELILRANYSLIRRDSGFINGVVCVLHDVTEQQKIEQDRKEFVSNVSHELRTPLTSIKSYVEALDEGAIKDDKLSHEFLNVISKESNRMIRMINDLLELSRLDRKTMPLQLEYIEMNSFIDYLINRFEMIIKDDDFYGKKKYTIEKDFSVKELWAEIDTDKMSQVVDNLMNNAIKYSPDGGVVKCSVFQRNDNIIFSISDQGLGMPAKDLDKIFTRFYRVDKARSRAQGGSGLGLSISQDIVDLHGGKIWATSIEGAGSTFYVSVPLVEVDESDEWNENS